MSTFTVEDGKLKISDSKIDQEMCLLIEKISKQSLKNKKAIEKLLNNEVVVTIAMNIEPVLFNKE